MQTNFRNILAALAFTTACMAQTAVPPPPDCLAIATKQTSGRPLGATAADCPPAPGTIGGSGTAGAIPVFTTPNTLGNSAISQSATGGIGIGAANAGTAKLAVTGNIAATGNIATTGTVGAGTVTATSVTATGNVTANTLTATGSITGNDVAAAGSIKATSAVISGSIAGNNITATGTVTGNTLAGTNITTSNFTASNDVNASSYRIGGQRVLSTFGFANTIAGAGAGQASAGNNNAYFGTNAGQFSATGSGNSFFGTEAGLNNGFNENSFFGHSAGRDFSGGNNNTLLGAGTTATNGIQNATAIGSKSAVQQSNSLILGSVDGVNGGTGVNVGIGTTQPASRLEVVGGDVYVASAGRGLILKTTSNFACVRLVVNNQGQLSTSFVPCPGSSGM